MFNCLKLQIHLLVEVGRRAVFFHFDSSAIIHVFSGSSAGKLAGAHDPSGECAARCKFYNVSVLKDGSVAGRVNFMSALIAAKAVQAAKLDKVDVIVHRLTQPLDPSTNAAPLCPSGAHQKDLPDQLCVAWLLLGGCEARTVFAGGLSALHPR